MLMIANDEEYSKIPGIVVKNPAKALSQELFNEATDSIHGKKLIMKITGRFIKKCMQSNGLKN